MDIIYVNGNEDFLDYSNLDLAVARILNISTPVRVYTVHGDERKDSVERRGWTWKKINGEYQEVPEIGLISSKEAEDALAKALDSRKINFIYDIERGVTEVLIYTKEDIAPF